MIRQGLRLELKTVCGNGSDRDPCGVLGGQSGTQTGFTQTTQVYSCMFLPILPIHSSTIGRLDRQVNRLQCHPDIVSAHQKV